MFSFNASPEFLPLWMFTSNASQVAPSKGESEPVVSLKLLISVVSAVTKFILAGRYAFIFEKTLSIFKCCGSCIGGKALLINAEEDADGVLGILNSFLVLLSDLK